MTAAAVRSLAGVSGAVVAEGWGADCWRDAELVAALLAIDPIGLGGARLRAGAGPVRDRWLDGFAALMPAEAPLRPAPCNIDDDRLVGGLNLTASLAQGAPVAEDGLLAAADGGFVILRMAERAAPSVAAAIASAMDRRLVSIERHGLSRSCATRFGLILLDEGVEADERAPDILCERVAFQFELDGVSARAAAPFSVSAPEVETARRALADVRLGDDGLAAMNAAALALGVGSIRALQFCANAARAAAALAGRSEVEDADLQRACRLVLVPRATMSPDAGGRDDDHPQAEDEAMKEPPGGEGDAGDAGAGAGEQTQAAVGELADRLIEAVRNAAAREALAALKDDALRSSIVSKGKSGAVTRSISGGRTIGARPGDWRRGGRIDIAATLRAAAPWRKMRAGTTTAGAVKILPQDIQIRQFEERSESVIVFVVDASGSSAMNRMAEAKGAVERLLSDCYARRDQVCLIAFRRDGAQVLLPPTRSLVRARKALAGLPGGGGTPLAAAILAAARVCEAERARGRAPYAVFLTDGRGNIALNGEPDREAAQRDVEASAALFQGTGCVSLVFDTAPRPGGRARELSDMLGAQYRILPYADGKGLSDAVRRTVSQRR